MVFHLAAQARVADSIRDPHRDGTVNVLGTVNMLRAAANAGVRRFVAASSGGTVYGQLPEGSRRLPESAPMRPISPYGAAKAATEHYLLVYRDLYGLPTTSIRLGNVYGPRRGGNSGADVVCRFVSAAVVGAQPSICGDGAQTRDFVHVSDAAEAFLLAGYHTDGGAFNVSSGEECAITALAQLVCAAFGMPFEPRYEPARPGEVRRVCLDTTRARRELGWRPTITLAEGIGELVDRARTGPLESAGARVAAGGGTGR